MNMANVARLIAIYSATFLCARTTLADDVNSPWIRQFGTPYFDTGYGVAVDGYGDVYVAGHFGANGSLLTSTTDDAYVRKYDAAGNDKWTSIRSTSWQEIHLGVDADAQGNVYTAGLTYQSYNSTTGDDAFVSKYNVNGALEWTHASGAIYDDVARAVSADGLGNVYVTGYKRQGYGIGDVNAYLSKYDEMGVLKWTQQLGTSLEDFGTSVSADATGSVFIVGHTRGNLSGVNAGNRDAFVSKYDDAGNLLWTRQLGTSNDEFAYGVAVDGVGNAFITGETRGSLGAPNPSVGSGDAFVAKYNAVGEHLWTSQLGTPNTDWSRAIATDRLGNAYIAGLTSGTLGGTPRGSSDAFVSAFNATGVLQWIIQTGTASSDRGESIAIDQWGAIYLAGVTNGDFAAPAAGGGDVFVMKIIVPEPGSFMLTMYPILGGWACGWRRFLKIRKTR